MVLVDIPLTKMHDRNKHNYIKKKNFIYILIIILKLSYQLPKGSKKKQINKY